MRESETNIAITTGSWVRAVLVILAVMVLFVLRDLLLIILVSIVIASAVEPAAIWARRKSIPRLPTILTVYISMGAVFAGIFYYLLLPLLGELSNFLSAFPEYSKAIASDPSLANLFGSATSSISAQSIVDHVNTLVSSLSTGIFSSAAFFFGGAFSFGLIVVLSFYLAVQDDGVGKFLRIVAPWKHEKYISSLWDRSKRKIGLWMQGQILLAVIIAVLVYLGLLIVRVDHPLLLAASAGMFEIIPLFGPILAAIPAILIAFSSGGMSLALVVAGLFIIIQQFENQLIYPLVVKKVVGVPPMVSIIALLIGGELAGFLGVVIAVPIAAVLMELLDDLEREKATRVSDLVA
jgi:predicted PurR-regulated permease PerM